MSIEKNQSSSNRELSFWAIIAVIPLCMFFGANAVAIRAGMTDIGVFSGAGIRFGLASIVLVVWAVISRQSLVITRKQFAQMVILAFIFVVQLSLFYFGLSKSLASRGTLIINSQPFFVLVLAHFFITGDRISIRKVIGIALAFLGIVAVFSETTGALGDFRFGDLFILGAAFAWGINAVYTKLIISSFKPLQIALYPMMLAAPVFFLEGFIWDSAMISDWSLKAILAIGYQVLTASVGYVIWVAMLRKYGAISLHSFVFIMPISGVLFGRLILSEPVTYKIIFSLILIATGLLIVHLKQDRFPPIFSLNRNL